jgi:hypothetical protein
MAFGYFNVVLIFNSMLKTKSVITGVLQTDGLSGFDALLKKGMRDEDRSVHLPLRTEYRKSA